MPGYDIRLTLRPAGTGPGEMIGDVQVEFTPSRLKRTPITSARASPVA
ncbi:MAG: hypothetical protein IPN48_01400 [Sphingomonadales bacterium]|nr:hypothetical protein [Sphingomonadales bacterium]